MDSVNLIPYDMEKVEGINLSDDLCVTCKTTAERYVIMVVLMTKPSA